MSAVEFVDEPVEPARNSIRAAQERQAFANALRAQPGRWAKYPWPLSQRTAVSRACEINSGRHVGIKALRGGGFEATAKDGTLFVRAVKR